MDIKQEDDETNTGSDHDEQAKWIQSLVDVDESFESPIDINLTATTPVELPLLNWHHLELPPKKMKLTNTGHTIILSAKWLQERPYLSDGPLIGNYVFSQLHFHWGANDMEGSEHTVDGVQLPLEMHVVHFKSTYLTQEAALKEKDGMVVLAYFFKLQSQANTAVQLLVDALVYIQKAQCSARIDPVSINFLVRKFPADYYLYWGSVTTTSCVHLILWLISREPIGISADQVESFRQLLDTEGEPLLRNFRNVQPTNNRQVYHVCPSGSKYSTLLAVPREPHPYFSSAPPKPPKPLPPAKPSFTSEVFRMDTICNTPFKYKRGDVRRSSNNYTKTGHSTNTNPHNTEETSRERQQELFHKHCDEEYFVSSPTNIQQKHHRPLSAKDKGHKT